MTHDDDTQGHDHHDTNWWMDDVWNMTYNETWHINHDIWHDTDIWHTTHDTWHMSHDICHIIHDTWHMTHNIRHMGHGHEWHNTWHDTGHMTYDTWKCLRCPFSWNCQHSWTACLRSRNACTPDLLEMLACALELIALWKCRRSWLAWNAPESHKMSLQKARDTLLTLNASTLLTCWCSWLPRKCRSACIEKIAYASGRIDEAEEKIINFLGKMERGNRDRHKIWAW
jgi:hypothetical protein